MTTTKKRIDIAIARNRKSVSPGVGQHTGAEYGDSPENWSKIRILLVRGDAVRVSNVNQSNSWLQGNPLRVRPKRGGFAKRIWILIVYLDIKTSYFIVIYSTVAISYHYTKPISLITSWAAPNARRSFRQSPFWGYFRTRIASMSSISSSYSKFYSGDHDIFCTNATPLTQYRPTCTPQRYPAPPQVAAPLPP